MPSRSITAIDFVLSGDVEETTSFKAIRVKPSVIAARAASVA